MSSSQYIQAMIVRLEPSREEIPCLFNPKEYTVSKSVQWGKAQNSSKDVSDMTFSGGEGASLGLELLFDTYYYRKSEKTVEDVRKYTDKLWKLMQIDEKLKHKGEQKGRPPAVMFQWGVNWSFKAVIASMEQQFTLFMPDGMPVRALVKVQLQQVDDAVLKPGSASGTFTISEDYRAAAKATRGSVDLRQVAIQAAGALIGRKW